MSFLSRLSNFVVEGDGRSYAGRLVLKRLNEFVSLFISALSCFIEKEDFRRSKG